MREPIAEKAWEITFTLWIGTDKSRARTEKRRGEGWLKTNLSPVMFNLTIMKALQYEASI